MSRWQVRVPHRSRDESLASAAAHARDLGPDAAWTRELMLGAIRAGDRTAGDLIDRLERMDPAERRQLIDEARAELGLEPTAEVDQREHFAALQRTRVQAVELVACAYPGCLNAPTRYGVPYVPDQRRWWCPDHADHAQPGDLEPRGSGIRIAPSGALIPDDPQDDAREAAVADFDRRQRAARDAERSIEAEAAAAHERARAEQFERELGVHP